MTIEKIIEALKSLTLQDLNNLVKEVEKEFGVSAAISASAPQKGGNESASEANEQTEFSVRLESVGGNKVAVIKVAREITGLGLMEAKALVEKPTPFIKEKIKKEEAQEIVEKLKAAGAEAKLV